jgi:hypothetical protein
VLGCFLDVHNLRLFHSHTASPCKSAFGPCDLQTTQ